MEFLARLLASVLAVLMGALISLIAAQIIMRFFVQSPLQWSLEVSRILFLWIVFLGAAFAVRAGQYSAVDVLSRRLPPWWTEKVVVGAMVLFAVLFAVLGTLYVHGASGGKFTMTGLPDAVVFVAPAVSGVLIGLFAVERLVKGGRRPGSGTGEISA